MLLEDTREGRQAVVTSADSAACHSFSGRCVQELFNAVLNLQRLNILLNGVAPHLSKTA